MSEYTVIKLKRFFLAPFIRSLAKKILPSVIQKVSASELQNKIVSVKYSDYWYEAMMIAEKAYIKFQ